MRRCVVLNELVRWDAFELAALLRTQVLTRLQWALALHHLTLLRAHRGQSSVWTANALSTVQGYPLYADYVVEHLLFLFHFVLALFKLVRAQVQWFNKGPRRWSPLRCMKMVFETRHSLLILLSIAIESLVISGLGFGGRFLQHIEIEGQVCFVCGLRVRRLQISICVWLFLLPFYFVFELSQILNIEIMLLIIFSIRVAVLVQISSLVGVIRVILVEEVDGHGGSALLARPAPRRVLQVNLRPINRWLTRYLRMVVQRKYRTVVHYILNHLTVEFENIGLLDWAIIVWIVCAEYNVWSPLFLFTSLSVEFLQRFLFPIHDGVLSWSHFSLI